jgi:hypothetical protein
MKPVVLEFDGQSLVAHLWDDRAPVLCGRIWEALPFEGQVTNTIWSGEMLRLWIDIPEPEHPENVKTLHSPGDILFVPKWNGLRLVYGQAMMRGPAGAHPVPVVGRLGGDLAPLVEFARRIEWEGARTMRVRRA